MERRERERERKQRARKVRKREEKGERKERKTEGKTKGGRKKRESKGEDSIEVTLYRFSKRYPLARLSFSFHFKFFRFLSSTFLPSFPSSVVFLSLPARTEIGAAPFGVRFHVYTRDGSDWPGLKPSQITP